MATELERAAMGPKSAAFTASSGGAQKSTIREKMNAYIHICYTRKDFNECLKKIEEQLKASNGQSEYPLYIKGE